MIDCDSRPFIPDGWSIKPEDQLANRVRGQIEFDPAKIAFHLDAAQKKGTIRGSSLKKKLAGATVYGAQVLDYLLAHPDLIPESWKTNEHDCTRNVFFWGTIYRNYFGLLFVRCLYWDDDRWGWFSYCVGHDFDGQDPAAVFAS
ncbi:MAG: hypothetical protein WCT10_05930 [Patescibacteria group bacterium]|jgi:hypothetical protein